MVHGYGGVVNQFTGDGCDGGVRGAEALEDHALLGHVLPRCVSGTRPVPLRSTSGVRDGIVLQLRVGLNSGLVIAGEIGSGAMGYTTIGEQVGLAQRMESIAPADGIMLSAATARLVEQSAVLGPPESVTVKGQSAAVAVRQLLAVTADRSPHRARWEACVGRAERLNSHEGDCVPRSLRPPIAGSLSATRRTGGNRQDPHRR